MAVRKYIGGSLSVNPDCYGIPSQNIFILIVALGSYSTKDEPYPDYE